MRTGSVHRFKMENHNTSPKFVKTNCSSEANGMVTCSKQHEPFRIHQSNNYGEEPKDRRSDKSKIAQKRSTKEQTRPTNIKLHTQQRAVERAGFNYLVASKLNYIEQQRQQEEKIQKMIEEEEIRMMRKEMIPRAQLMPFFDRPFFPQRSTRPLTIPREPSFHICSSKCWRCISCCELYSYHEPRKSVR